MTLPATQKSWIFSPNNRIPFVSLNDTMARYLFGVKVFLTANGYTVRGSSNGVAGAMDLTDRWVTFSNVTTRGAAAGNSQSWIVLRDGNGVDILLAYQGASDDIARISFSPGKLFVAAGTPIQQPTATDEVVIASATTLIGLTASGDRIWNGWVSSDAKLCRFNIAKSGIWVGQVWGVEQLTSSVVTQAQLAASPITFSPKVWGFATIPTSNPIVNSTVIGLVRLSASSVASSVGVRFQLEENSNSSTTWGALKTDLQGLVGYPLFPLGVGSVTTSYQGKVGNLIDWWLGRTSGFSDGETYGLNLIIALANGIVWPWDGVTVPMLI